MFGGIALGAQILGSLTDAATFDPITYLFGALMFYQCYRALKVGRL